MKVRFTRWYNAVLTALLSMLGYGCSSTEEPLEMYGPLLVEYGVPHADYIFKGTIKDEVGSPVQGIKTSLKAVFDNDNKRYVMGLDSVQSDASGNYQLEYTGTRRDPSLKIIVEDTDGQANGGEFLSDTLDIDFDKAVKVKEGSGWYQGEFEVSQDVKLKKKP